MGNQQSTEPAVIPAAPKKRSGGSAFQCLAGLDSTGEAQLKKSIESNTPLDVNTLFSKYKIENIQDNFRASLLKVGNKVMITSMVEQIINEKLDGYLSAVSVP